MSTEIVEPVGALTLLDRETWADVLPLLIKGNQYAIVYLLYFYIKNE